MPWPATDAGAGRSRSITSGLGHPADIARDGVAVAATSGRIYRIDAARARTSADLLPRLPHEEAIALASLAANGHMSWAEINAALNAKVKLATGKALRRDRRQSDLMAAGWRHDNDAHDDDAWAAYSEWNEAKRTGEGEIWARYHAKCDAMFANAPDYSGTSARAHEQLLNREHALDVFRMARDDELAALAQGLGPQPARSTTFPARPMSVQIAMLKSRLSKEETDAIDKLEGTGFTESADMSEIIGVLASEIAGAIPDVA